MAEAHFKLPEEQPEQAEQVAEQVDQGQVQEQAPVVETVGKAQESAAGKQVAQIYAQPQAPVALNDQTAAAPTQTTTPQTDDDKAIAKLPAKDGDLIEKEWVERAKSIVAKTADDPHKQKHEVSKIKAAYIQKRFNKIIKTDEATV